MVLAIETVFGMALFSGWKESGWQRSRWIRAGDRSASDQVKPAPQRPETGARPTPRNWNRGHRRQSQLSGETRLSASVNVVRTGHSHQGYSVFQMLPG